MFYSSACLSSSAPFQKMSEEVPFTPIEKLYAKQKYYQNIHKYTHLKGPYDKITYVAIPGALAATCIILMVRGVYNMSHNIGKKQ